VLYSTRQALEKIVAQATRLGEIFRTRL